MSLISDRRDVLPVGEGTTGQPPLDRASIHTSNVSFDELWQVQEMWVDRMCHLLWVRSPAFEFTLRNARNRYQESFASLASSPNAKLPPPPDLELVWLTHQLSPSNFAKLSKGYAGRIAKQDVSTKGPDQYNMVFSHCFCWDCQNLQRLAENNPDDEDSEKLVEQSMREIAYHRALEYARRTKLALQTKNSVDDSKNGLP